MHMDKTAVETEFPGDAYWAEVLMAVDLGQFKFDGGPETEQLVYEYMKMLQQSHVGFG